MLAFHRESKQPVPTSANELLEGVLAMFRAHMSGMGIELASNLSCDDQILVNPGEIRQVFGNIISNALDAISPLHGKLRVRCFRARDEKRNQIGVRFLFSDNGPGISAVNMPHIFEAFYTTKQSKGSGIGLWLSSEVIQKHRGRIRLRTRTYGRYTGTLFDVFFPIS